MEDYKLYESKLNVNIKRNEKFLKEFEDWLNDKKLSSKIIKRHLNNADLYINDYLNYYEITKMEDGTDDVYTFLNDWAIRKCLFTSISSLKETTASIKKFYKCMNEKGYIKDEDYEILCLEISQNRDAFVISF